MGISKRFAGYPSAFVYDSNTRNTSGKPKGKVIEHLLWGQYVGLFTGSEAENKNGFYKVRIRENRVGWMETGDLQKERLLEVIFVDIGQGDGCLLVTPDDKFFIIDAGQSDNMYRFLRWRYNFDGQDDPIPFIGVLSHPDSDHYAGFTELFEDDHVVFEQLYHNGIMERCASTASKELGPRKKVGGKNYLTELIRTKQDLTKFLRSGLWKHATTPRYNKQYPGMLNRARKQNKYKKAQMLHTGFNGGFVPGYEADKKVTMRILGPVLENLGGGKRGLRWLGSKGKTKNGHSIVIRLEYGEVSVLLGGDLNIESEKLLLEHHTEMKIPKETNEQKYSTFITEARTIFQVDVAKSCHHGSADFLRTYLDSISPIVTVISSGDDESHSHPRADTLGTIGKYSRGTRSLVFNTELARSTGERLEIPMSIRRQLEQLAVAIDEIQDKLKDLGNELTADIREELEQDLANLKVQRERKWEQLARSVDVYGAINLRTDGKRIVMAQKLERKRGDSEWDIYQLEKSAGATDFEYQSKHEH